MRSQIPRRWQDRFRPVTRNLYGSARRRLLAQLNMSNVAEVRHLDFVNRSRRLLVAEPQVRRAAKEKECRALMVSRLRHNSTRSRSRRSSSSKVARLPQPITARATGSRKVETRNNQKKRHRHGHNNFGAITPAAPERETPEPLFLERASSCSGVCVRRRSHLFVIGKTLLIWPLFPVRGQTSSNRILSNIIPFFVD